MDLLGPEAEPVDEPVAAVLGVYDDGVDAVIEAPLGSDLSASRLARKDVMGGQDERSAGRQQAHVQRLDREPLEVHDVCRGGGPPILAHVGHVLHELSGEPPARSGRAAAAAVEALDALICVGRGDGSVRKAAGLQAHVHSRSAERGTERMVVGRRVGRGIHDVDAHRGEVSSAPGTSRV